MGFGQRPTGPQALAATQVRVRFTATGPDVVTVITEAHRIAAEALPSKHFDRVTVRVEDVHAEIEDIGVKDDGKPVRTIRSWSADVLASAVPLGPRQ
jgi:hypothetical protein